MLNYLIRRVAMACLLTLFVSFLAYVLIFAAGDPATALAGEAATAEDAARLREAQGWNDPIVLQYARWLGGVLQGDLGQSLYFDQPVSSVLLGRFSMTAKLGALALAFALITAIPLGVIAGRWPNSIIDRIALLIAVVGQAMPTFWFALLLIILFSIHFPILPASGAETWKHFVLPTIVLGYFAMPALMRLTRSGMIAALETDYIRTARAMGLSETRILFDYALRNAALPVVSLASAQFGFALAGSVVVESVFAIHGAGRLAWESIARADLPTVQALVLCFSLFYVVLTLLADMLNAMLDPRMRTK